MGFVSRITGAVSIFIFSTVAGAQGSPTSFHRMTSQPRVDQPQIVDRALEMGITLYRHPDSQVTVRYIPITHVGEASFYEQADAILQATDVVLYEMVRPTGFFGPPFEDDPTVKTEKERFERTQLRLQTLQNAVKAYTAKFKNAPGSWQDVFAEKYEMITRALLFDAWGAPIQLQQMENGQLDAVASHGLRMSQVPPRRPYFLSRLGGRLKGVMDFLATRSELAHQPPFSVYWRPGSQNIDVSGEQFWDIPIWKAFSLYRRWNARMAYPVTRLKAYIAQLDPSVKKEIGLVYGAAHGIDFDHALVQELGFQVAEQQWLPIIRAVEDTSKSQQDSSVQEFRLHLIRKLSTSKRRAPALGCQELLERVG